MDDFKNLNLDRKKIYPALEQYCKDTFKKFEIKRIRKKEDDSITIITDEEQILLQIFYKKNENTTLHYKLGKNQEKSKEIANYLSEKCKYPEEWQNLFF